MADNTEYFELAITGTGKDRMFTIEANKTDIGLPAFDDANAAFDACDRLNELANEIAGGIRLNLKPAKPKQERKPRIVYTPEQITEVMEYMATEIAAGNKRQAINLAIEKFGVTRGNIKKWMTA